MLSYIFYNVRHTRKRKHIELDVLGVKAEFVFQFGNGHITKFIRTIAHERGGQNTTVTKT